MIEFDKNKFPHKYTTFWTNTRMGICTYVWKLLFTMVFCWTMAAFVGAVIGLVLIGMMTQGMILFTDITTSAIFSRADPYLLGLSLVVFYIAVAIAAWVGGTVLYDEWRLRKRNNDFLKPKMTTDSVILEYIKAKKEKWCPTVRVV